MALWTVHWLPLPRCALHDGLKPDIDALFSLAQFKLPKFDNYRAICEVLEGKSCVSDAITCFQRMQSELTEDTSYYDGRAQWELGGWLRQQ